MAENPRFELVFAKLRSVLEDDAHREPAKARIEVRPFSEASPEELEEIDALRRIVLEVTEPEPVSFTTT
jgi:hypothetical protein